MIVVTRQVESGWKHFQARFSEWLNAAILFAWGIYLNLHPDMMTRQGGSAVWSGLVSVMSQPAWALVALICGGARLGALYINGAHTRTPLIRLITAFFSAFVFTQITMALFNSDAPNTGVVVYAFLVVADIYSAFRASADMTFVAKVTSVDGSAEEGRVVHFGKSAVR